MKLRLSGKPTEIQAGKLEPVGMNADGEMVPFEEITYGTPRPGAMVFFDAATNSLVFKTATDYLPPRPDHVVDRKPPA